MTMDLFDDINKTISDSDLCKAFMNNPLDDGKLILVKRFILIFVQFQIKMFKNLQKQQV